MMTLCALSLNPNLSVEQFEKLADEHMAAKERCFKIVGDALETLEPEAVAKYLVTVLPLLMTW